MRRPKPTKKKVWPSAAILTMFGAAVFLLLFGSIGGARAALTYYSDTYSSQVRMYDIGVTLRENGTKVAWRDYDSKKADGTWKTQKGAILGETLINKETGEKEPVEPGRKYDMELCVENSGNINEYIRVTIYKYWLKEGSLDADGNKTDSSEKLQELDPELIKLNFINTNFWIEDTLAKTKERTVLYYNQVLEEEEWTRPFADSLMIDGSIAQKVTQKETTVNGRTEIVTTYDYDGVQFWIEVEVDAVQEHNAEDAIWSAWGRRVRVDSDGELRLRSQ